MSHSRKLSNLRMVLGTLKSVGSWLEVRVALGT